LTSLPAHVRQYGRHPEAANARPRGRTCTLRVMAGWSLAALAIGACQPTPSAPATSPTPRRTAPALGPTSSSSARAPAGNASTPTPSLAPIPTPSAQDWQQGPATAAVTLLIYTDFQCQPCNAASRAIAGVLKRHPADVRIVYRPFPLYQIDDKAQLAALAAEAAGRQGKFWAMYAALVEQYQEWRGLSPGDFQGWLGDTATNLGLNTDRFLNDLTDQALTDQLAHQIGAASASGVPGAPFVLLNGRPFLLASDEAQLEAAVRLAQLQTQQFAVYPEFDLDPGADYLATVTTSRGTLQIQLYAATAPLAVNSFIKLAQSGWYDGSGAYQVVPGRWVAFGDPTATGLGDVGYHYPVETDPSRRFDRAGVVGMINSGPAITGGKFFISLVPLPEYDNDHTVLGHVSEGLDLLSALSARSPLTDLLTPPALIIQSVRIETR
jgi:cyclophilin family peptidyl-prolyl cis-trans isomerase/protein-disulfide isomerase